MKKNRGRQNVLGEQNGRSGQDWQFEQGGDVSKTDGVSKAGNVGKAVM
jgi:hypothetical protein